MRRLTHPALSLTVIGALLSTTGCFAGHAVSLDKLTMFSNAVEPGVVEVEAEDGQTLAVSRDTIVEVTDLDGLQHRIQPFSFQVSRTQLVAPEQDLLLGLDSIEAVEIRVLSTALTLGIVGVGLVAAGAMAASVLLTEGDQSFEN